MKRFRRFGGLARLAILPPLILSAALGQQAMAAYSSAPDDPQRSKPSPVVKAPIHRSVATVSVVLPKTAVPNPARTAAPPPRRAVRADKTALLIGVNNAPGSPHLEGSITDARNMSKALLGYGFKGENIDMLADPTRSQILDGLASLNTRTSGNGIAVFLLSTHSSRRTGTATFATGGGGRISAPELASFLAHVPGKLVSLIPTCYAGAYKLPGIVGAGRLAVFSSDADEYSYQLGAAGSWLVLYMVRYAMLQKKAPSSVEAAYRWTKATLDESAPNRSPNMSDGIAGDVVLGPVPK